MIDSPIVRAGTHRRLPSVLFVLLLLLYSSVASAQQTANTDSADAVQFNRDIRPILSDHCFACHGPDKNKREADLRLDSREGLLGGDGAAGVVKPGAVDESELYRRITAAADEQMPPPEFGKPLAAEDIELVRRWIQQGANWEGHWSFQPIQRPSPPDDDPEWAGLQPVDRFIAAGLQQHGLPAAPAADPITLIRRLHFDLTGLPPTPQEVDAYLADPSPRQYEARVDQLLASPQFGERMAMWWLDLVRYADSVGYHGDQPVSVFPFRDYVIQSFNDNKPFDQFTIEQLAGDLLPEATLEQRIASGYNRLGMMSAEGGVQPKEYLAKYIAERVRNVGGTWLGMTLGCCECHDHKYDPLLSQDFYAMEAFFADIKEVGLYAGANVDGNWGPKIQVPTAEQAAQRQQLQQQIDNLRQQLDTETPELQAAQQQWEQQQRAERAAWVTLNPHSFEASDGIKLELLDDGSLLASGESPATSNYRVTIADPPAGITALRLEALPHDSLPSKGPGRAANGNFVLTEITAAVQAAAEEPAQSVALQNATATYEQVYGAENAPRKKWSAADAIDGDAQGTAFGWAILEQVGRPQHAVFETASDTSTGAGTILTIELRQQNASAGHTLGRFRLSASTAARPVRASSLPPDIAALVDIAEAQRSAEQREKLAAYYRSIAPELAEQRKSLSGLQAQLEKLDTGIPTTLITVAVEPRTIRVLPRGNWMDDSGPIVEPATPAVLPQPARREGRLTRLDLAQWIVAHDNPLTSRVLANRLWKLFFGAGLSTKLDDLGAQGDWPSHPLLLDYLASELLASGWDIKHVVKLLVMSDAYRRSSAADPDVLQRDPYNRWLARQSRFRLDAEVVRDNALKISGLLDRQIGGPSVKPYQPPGYWAYLNFPAREWENGSGNELYRRGLYTHWQRQYLHPALLAFDAPSREECTAERSRSNTPLQSLVLMNDPEFVEAARVFAQRVLTEGGDDSPQRLQWAFRQVLSRAPREQEMSVLAGLLENHLQQYRDDPQSADSLLSVGQAAAPGELDRATLAAWTSVTRTLLNLHETITRN